MIDIDFENVINKINSIPKNNIWRKGIKGYRSYSRGWRYKGICGRALYNP